MKRTILITGSSRGIGAATALLTSKKGYCVCINYFQNALAAENIVKIIIDNGGKVLAYQADVSSESEVISLFSKIDFDFGSLVALVNNAGILELQSRLDKMELDRIQRVINTNIISNFLCSKEAIKRMSTKYGGKVGSIINVSSIASKTGSPNEYIDYASSKGAIDTLTIGLAKELAGEGIRVNAVRPGFIYTDIHADGGEPNRVDRLKTSIPLGRGGQPVEIANAIMWLLSEESSFITGSIVDASGGF